MRDVIRRAGRFLIGDAVARGIAFVVLLAGARALGPAEFGRFAAVYAAVGVGLLVTDLGLTPLVLRTLSRRGFRAGVFWTGAFVNLVLSTTVFAFVAAAVAAVAPSYLAATGVLGWMLVVQALASSFDALLLAGRRSTTVAVVRVCGNASLALAAAVALAHARTAVALAAAFTAANVVKGSLSFVFVRRTLGRPVVRRRLARA